ncbi:MAG: hypothetical protein H6978_11900 [Gammaproteobacteria bacterium]|nr:hypothetical protein [Gammaproteobacteria bacterium]
MFSRCVKSGSVALLAAMYAGVSVAHHSVGVFDTTTPVRVKGNVVRVDFVEPHAVIFLEQKPADGAMVKWAVESSPPIAVLQRRGFTRDTLKPGDTIEVCGYAPKKSYFSGQQNSAFPEGPWEVHPDRVITGRLLLLPGGPDIHWSHYGPLDKCISAEDLAAMTASPPEN